MNRLHARCIEILKSYTFLLPAPVRQLILDLATEVDTLRARVDALDKKE